MKHKRFFFILFFLMIMIFDVPLLLSMVLADNAQSNAMFSETDPIGNKIHYNCGGFEKATRAGGYPKTNKIKIGIDENDNNHYILFKTDDTSSDYHWDLKVKKPTRYIVIDFCIRTNSDIPKGLLTYKNINSASEGSIMSFDNNSVVFKNGTSVNITSETWYNIALVCDFLNSTVTSYVNGDLIQSEQNIAIGKYKLPISSLRFHFNSSKTAEIGTNIMLDNLKVYEGTEPRYISNDESQATPILDWSNDDGNTLYIRPTQAQIRELISEYEIENSHPRVIMNKEMCNNVIHKYETDEDVNAWGNLIIAQANTYLSSFSSDKNKGTFSYKTDSTKSLNTNREIYERSKYFSMAYILTKDSRYADCLYEIFEIGGATDGSFPNWGTNHYLNVSEMCAAYAIGYDWLYDYWDNDQKGFLEETIKNRSLLNTRWEYFIDSSDHWVTRVSNWNIVCNGGNMMGAVAVCDKYPDLCAENIALAIRSAEYTMNGFYPSGGWEEGVSYWGYTLSYTANMLSTLDACFGTDFNLSKAPGFSDTYRFFLACQGNHYLNEFHDTPRNSTQQGSKNTFFWISNKFNLPDLTKLRLYYIRNGISVAGPLELIWYNAEIKSTDYKFDNDYYIENIELVSMKGKYVWCSGLYERYISGYNGTRVNVKYDDCNPFGMIAGDFGEIASLSKHTMNAASNSTIVSFNTLSELFATFMGNFEIPTNGTEYIPTISGDTLNSYTQFYNKAIELYNNSLVSFTKNVGNDLTRSAVIGVNHPYTMAFGTDVSPELINFQTVIANLFGFSSKTEFMDYAQNLANTYAEYRTSIANSTATNEALENGCFYTTNGSFVFPIAVKNELSSTVLAYVILDTNGLVSVWINDITAALMATNFNASYYTDSISIINNELYCKNILFITGTAAWLSFHGGKGVTNHFHLDTGTFLFEVGGVRWAIDLGKEADRYFSSQSEKLQLYKIRPEGHNVYIINPSDDVTNYGQTTSHFAEVTKLETGENIAFSILDLTQAYRENVTDAKRGYMLSDNRRSGIIRDEITFKEQNSEIYWFMHVIENAEINIVDEHTAYISSNNKTLKFMIDSDLGDYEFGVMYANPLSEETKLGSMNAERDGNKKLYLKGKSSNDDNKHYIQCKMILADDENAEKSMNNLCLDEWSIYGKITVKHIDMVSGDILATDNLINEIGMQTTTSVNEITDFVIVEKPDKEIYTINEEEQTVNYYYSRIANVFVFYQTKDGITLSDDVTINGYIGKEYVTEEKSFENYELIETNGNVSGVMTNEQQSVTYYYQRIEGQNTDHNGTGNNSTNNGSNENGVGDKPQILSEGKIVLIVTSAIVVSVCAVSLIVAIKSKKKKR